MIWWIWCWLIEDDDNDDDVDENEDDDDFHIFWWGSVAFLTLSGALYDMMHYNRLARPLFPILTHPNAIVLQQYYYHVYSSVTHCIEKEKD